MRKTHRIVIIGAGAVAGAIARAIGDLPNATLVAASRRNREKGEAFAGQHGCQWYEDAEVMLQRERPDVAVIATPSGAHLDGVLLCARYKVHALCEKPLEISVDRCRRMIDAANQAGIHLGGIFPQRFGPSNQAAHAAISQGRFGKLAILSAWVPWWREDSYYGEGRWQGSMALDGGGALMNQSIHNLDLLQWFASAGIKDSDAMPVTEVFACTDKLGHDPKLIEVEDAVLAIFRFANGGLGQLLGTTAAWPGSLRRMLLAGRDGTIEIHEDTLLTYRFRDQKPEDEELCRQLGAKTAHAGGAGDPMAFDHRNHSLNIREFLAAMDEKRTPLIDGREAAKSVAIAEACYESARTGRPVKPTLR
jgi:predicted dehydrogenase